MTARLDAAGRAWTIARRELRALFDHPTGYVLLVVLLGANGFLFFRQAYLSGLASLRPMFDLLPWLFLFFVPAVTMRTLAEDHRGGLLETVLTQPITELEFLLGKFGGAVLFLWAALALTLPIPIGLTLGSDLPWGPVVAQYVGGALLAAGLAGVGVWASSLTRSQITAFILAIAISFLLILVGLNPLIVGLPPMLGAIAARLGVLSHFQNIGRGVIDLRDAVYFLSLAGVFLALAYASLAGRLLSSGGERRRRLRVGSALIVATLVVVNLLGGYIGGRLDLTPGKAYTLSRGSKQIVGALNDLVTVKLFASEELPTEVALLKRDIDDLLSDLRSAGRGRVRVVRLNPATDSAAARDARTLGIGPVQFNVVGQAELQVKEGYLGLSVQYGAKNETIPFVSRSDDLEYRLASAIRGLTRTTKPVVGFIESGRSSPDPRTGQGAFQTLRSELAKTYEVRELMLSDSTQPEASLNAIVAIGSPDTIPPDAAARLRAFFKRGGSALILAAGNRLEEQMPFAQPQTVSWNEILRPYGVSVRSDMVYDLVANEVVPSRSSFGPFQVMQRYPFFIRAQSTGRSSVNRDVREVFMPWPSSVDTSRSAPGTVTPLVVTSRASGVSSGMTSIEPGRAFERTDLASRLLAVQVTPKGDSATARGRLVLVGSSEFVRDQFVGHAPENVGLVLNAVDWLSQEEALIAIRATDRRPPSLRFTSVALQQGVRYGVVIGVPLLVAIGGVVRLARRRARSRLPYRPLSGTGAGAAQRAGAAGAA